MVFSALLVPVLAACGAGTAGSGSTAATSLVLYTCLSDESVQPVITAFEGRDDGGQRRPLPRPDRPAERPGRRRRPVAAACGADVFWGCDPLTVQALVDQHLVGGWTPADAAAIPATVPHRRLRRRPRPVHGGGAPHERAGPDDLGGPGAAAATRKLAVPDPAVAASALGALGWFAAEPGYGMDFYRQLQEQGCGPGEHPGRRHQRRRPGRLRRGDDHGQLRLRGEERRLSGRRGVAGARRGGDLRADRPRHAQRPLRRSRRTSSPSSSARTARPFSADRGPTRPCPASAGPTVPPGAPVVSPDWTAIEAHKDAILSEYQQVFGG